MIDGGAEALGPMPAQQLLAVHARHPEVEDDGVKGLLGEHGRGLEAVGRGRRPRCPRARRARRIESRMFCSSSTISTLMPRTLPRQQPGARGSRRPAGPRDASSPPAASGEAAADGQADARAPALGREEGIEDALACPRAATPVPRSSTSTTTRPSAGAHLDLDAAPRPAALQGVAQQVLEDRAQPLGSIKALAAGPDGRAHEVAAGRGAVPTSAAIDGRVDGRGLARGVPQEVVDAVAESGEALDFAVDDLHLAPRLGGHGPREDARLQPDRQQRVLDLVGQRARRGAQQDEVLLLARSCLRYSALRRSSSVTKSHQRPPGDLDRGKEHAAGAPGRQNDGCRISRYIVSVFRSVSQKGLGGRGGGASPVAGAEAAVATVAGAQDQRLVGLVSRCRPDAAALFALLRRLGAGTSLRPRHAARCPPRRPRSTPRTGRRGGSRCSRSPSRSRRDRAGR